MWESASYNMRITQGSRKMTSIENPNCPNYSKVKSISQQRKPMHGLTLEYKLLNELNKEAIKLKWL